MCAKTWPQCNKLTLDIVVYLLNMKNSRTRFWWLLYRATVTIYLAYQVLPLKLEMNANTLIYNETPHTPMEFRIPR